MMKNAFYWKSSVTLNKQNQSTAKKKVCKTSEEMHTKKKNDKRWIRQFFIVYMDFM